MSDSPVLKLEWLDHDPVQAFEDIRECSILSYFPDDFLDILSTFGETRMIQASETILQEGDVNSEFYFLLSGAVDVVIDEKPIYRLSEIGEVFGEMSLIAEAPCTASVKAVEDSCFLIFSHQEIKDIVEQNTEEFGFVLYQVFSKVLTKRLSDANHKTQLIEKKNAELNRMSREIEMVAHERFQELWGKGNLTYDHLERVYKNEICTLMDAVSSSDEEMDVNTVRERLAKIQKSLSPIFQIFEQEKGMRNKRVLVAESDKRYQRFVKTALVGAGVSLRTVEDREEAIKTLNQEVFDFVLVSPQLIEVAEIAHGLNPKTKHVLMVSEEAQLYSHYLQKHWYISNIMSLHENARIFTLKNIFTTLGKLTSGDIFGMERYLNWGVQVQKNSIVGQSQKAELMQEMEKYFARGGMREAVINRCRDVADEMLMNAVFDAPVDENGKPKFNHLTRSSEVELDHTESGEFHYACDGVMAAIAVQDPFGSLDKETLMSHMRADTARSEESEEAESKAGAGLGLRLIVENSDLVVFNIKKDIRTEVIAFFNVDRKAENTFEHPVFHLCYEE